MQETVPGGKYKVTGETLVRFQPLVSPFMTKATVKMMYFYCPYRILWANWENFIMGKKDPQTDLDPIHPYYTAWQLAMYGNDDNGVNTQRLPDYFGVKTPQGDQAELEEVKLNPFHLAAYSKIWNRYFRHKAIFEVGVDTLQDGAMSGEDFMYMSNPKLITTEDDYFTQILPTPQQGEPIFIDDQAPVKIDDTSHATWSLGGAPVVRVANVDGQLTDDVDVTDGQLYADMKVNVEEIRRATALQKFVEMERHTQGSYIDYLKAFYNVDFPDSRAQEPIYIGGSSQPIMISDVMNTADANQGRVTGSGTGYLKTGNGDFYAHEHGVIIGVAVVTYDNSYMNAKNKLHLKTGRFDYFNPQFDGLGEQVVKMGEISPIRNDVHETFGYVPRHFEYRKSFDLVTGEMATSYMHWHLAKNYAYPPSVGITSDFYDVLDERRIFVYQSPEYDPIMLQCYNNVFATLPMGKLPIADL
jgi:hypothetical protein